MLLAQLLLLLAQLLLLLLPLQVLLLLLLVHEGEDLMLVQLLCRQVLILGKSRTLFAAGE
jgi:hypothetical protein